MPMATKTLALQVLPKILANAMLAAEGLRLSTLELGIRIVAPRSFVVS